LRKKKKLRTTRKTPSISGFQSGKVAGRKGGVRRVEWSRTCPENDRPKYKRNLKKFFVSGIYTVDVLQRKKCRKLMRRKKFRALGKQKKKGEKKKKKKSTGVIWDTPEDGIARKGLWGGKHGQKLDGM